MTETAWQNRIVGHADVPPDQLLANPANFRRHPRTQQDALSGVIGQIGYLDPVIATQDGTVIDGHLRVELAMRAGQPTIPVTYVDLTEAEANLALATMDPISAMAYHDAANLDALLREVSTDDAAVSALLSDLAESAGIIPGMDAPLEPGEDRYREQYGVIVMCTDEAHQQRVYGELQAAGHECRIVVT